MLPEPVIFVQCNHNCKFVVIVYRKGYNTIELDKMGTTQQLKIIELSKTT